jgi:Acetyltransferase (GNAT) domain
MRWNGEEQANAGGGAAPATMPLGIAGPFDRADWFDRLAAMHFKGLRRADGFGQSGSAAAWLPLVALRPGVHASLANWYSFVHRPQFSGARDMAAQQRALTDLCAGLRHNAARLTLYPVPEQDGSAAMLRAALTAAGWWVSAHPVGDNHWLELGGMDHDGWWATRPGELRSTVARKAKKGVVDISIADQFDAAMWTDYQRIYAASWKPEEGNMALLRAFSEAEGAAGRLRLGLARIGGAPVAAQLWTVENFGAYIHKLAHADDSLRASPGTLLTAALFRHVISEDQVRRVDFGTGDDRYKRDWMNRHSKLWRIEAFNPARPAAWGPAIKSTLADWRQHRKHG